MGNNESTEAPGGLGAGVIGQAAVDRELAQVRELEEVFGEGAVAAMGLPHAVRLLAWGKKSKEPAPKHADTIEELARRDKRIKAE
jgi:hypothetical protein